MGIRNLKQREIELISWMIKNKDKGPSIIKTLGSLLVIGDYLMLILKKYKVFIISMVKILDFRVIIIKLVMKHFMKL